MCGSKLYIWGSYNASYIWVEHLQVVCHVWGICMVGRGVGGVC